VANEKPVKIENKKPKSARQRRPSVEPVNKSNEVI
jgi:hypothetical protein